MNLWRQTIGLIGDFLLLFAGCSGVVLSPAIAKQPATADDPRPSPEQDEIPDIIVTARRRPELLQQTPLSVIALTRRDLEARSVTNLRSLQNFVPNLTF